VTETVLPTATVPPTETETLPFGGGGFQRQSGRGSNGPNGIVPTPTPTQPVPPRSPEAILNLNLITAPAGGGPPGGSVLAPRRTAGGVLGEFIEDEEMLLCLDDLTAVEEEIPACGDEPVSDE
jgi:hypothetical protein